MIVVDKELGLDEATLAETTLALAWTRSLQVYGPIFFFRL